MFKKRMSVIICTKAVQIFRLFRAAIKLQIDRKHSNFKEFPKFNLRFNICVKKINNANSNKVVPRIALIPLIDTLKPCIN